MRETLGERFAKDGTQKMKTALLTSSLTVIGGLVIFFFSQLIQRYIIEPLSDYRKLRSQISIHLVYYANVYSSVFEYDKDNSGNEKIVSRLEEVSNTFRRLASELIGISNIIPMYWFFTVVGIIPSRKKIKAASSSLIGLSNSLWSHGDGHDQIKYNRERRDEIVRTLKIKSM